MPALVPNGGEIVASFDAFFPTLLKHEGGFVNDPADPGGATNKGITMATFQKCARALLDIAPTLENLKAITDAQAGRIYKPLYWDRIHGDEIESQDLANIVFDFQVNAGTNAGKLLQRTLNESGARPPLAVDGDVGPATIAVLKGADQRAIYRRFRQGRIDYYRDLVDNHPALRRFLKGWLARVESFPNL
ncbi:MAG TPA: glycosyl hydrolase 108 family protein [Burkholderiales bacterium]